LNEIRSGYIMLDMPCLPDIDLKHFHRLFRLTSVSNEGYTFRILIVCNELNQSNELPPAPKLILRPYPEKELMKILLNDLLNATITCD